MAALGPVSARFVFLMVCVLSAFLPGPHQAETPLTGEECRRLYLHELEISLKDPLHPQRAALEQARKTLLSENVIKAQVDACRKETRRETFTCALKGRSLGEILSCRLQPGTDKAKPDDPSGGGMPKQDKPDPSKDPADPAKENTIQPVDVKVDSASCTRAYAHLLSVYENSEVLKKRPDKDKLLAHWRSKAAVDSFQNRCLTTFRSQDLGCMMSTRDPDVIQGCLLVAPDLKK